MANIRDHQLQQIIYYRNDKKVIDGEIFVKQHAIEYILCGTSEVFFDGKPHLFNEGDFRFAVKNRLSRFVKHPAAGGEYSSIVIYMDEDSLKELSEQYEKDSKRNKHVENLFVIEPNKLLKSYIDSLQPYLSNDNQITADLIKAKIREIVLILISTDPTLKDILFDFREPGKIDLEAYMTEHYRYNGDLHDFAFLTGRSLSTFKRDFENIFCTTPTKWLIHKRLEDAHYLLKEKKWRSSDVYLEVGFKDYSHFSVTFKKLFGVAPSMVSSISGIMQK